MMKKRLLSGLLISSMAVLLAATPVLAVEADAEGGNPETLSSGSEISEPSGGDDSEAADAETVDLESTDMDGSASADNFDISADNVAASDDNDTNESISTGGSPDEYVSAETGLDEIISDSEDGLFAEFPGDADGVEDDDIDPEEYGIATLAKTADTIVEDGFYQDPDSGDWYYYTDGQIDTDMNSVIKDTDKRIKETAEWWYVVGGKVQMDFTGLADYKNSSGWWYITNGMVDRSYNGLAENINGMFYITDGKVDRSYNGLAGNQGVLWYVVNGKVDKTYTGFTVDEDGSWYVENGQVTQTTNSVIKDTSGVLGTKNEWYYVVGSKVQYDFTGLANYSNSSGWWYITNGVVDRTYAGLAKNKNGWYYLTKGKVDRSYTGFAVNENGSWYVTNGKLTRNDNTVIKDTKGVLGSTDEWYYVVGSKVQYDFTGLANYSNSSGWWYITNGRVDRTYAGLAKNKNGWYYLTKGKVDRSYTGFAVNENGSWYVTNGKLTRNDNTVIKDTNGVLGSTDEWYYVIGSKVQYDFTGLANYSNASGWWYITKGKVDRTFTGVAENKNGTYYIKNGKVQKSFTGTVTVGEETYSVVNGKATIVESDDGDSGTQDDGGFTLSPEDINYAGKDTTELEAPIFSGVVDGNNGTMTLTWDSVPGAEKYRVFRKEYGDSSWTKLGDTTSTSYMDHLWNESKVYYYTVRCVSADGSEYMSDYIKGFSGSAVAEYAKQFEGNPYVYGGSSLTNGCDCSGFVMQVYAHFGVYLPHQSGVQITLGQAVSVDDIQPGDIVGRSGHTTIYIGDGQVIHAQDSAHGICITPLSSTSYTNIRRIF